MTLYNSNGKGRSAESNTTSKACDFLQNFYGNFHPSRLKYDFVSSFRIDASGWCTKPGYIKESHFGVTDAKFVVVKRSVIGSDVQITEHHVLNDTNQSLAAMELFTTKANLSIASVSYTLRDGERLCVQFKVHSGGYVVSKNEYSIDDPPRPYDKPRATRELCYRFDSSSPVHCQETHECSFEPLEIRDRITRNPVIPVKFRGWQDPIPENGNQEHASGIESYTITVNEVVPPNGTLGSSIFSTKVNASVSNVYLNLTSDTTKLYCISIETKDVADNIQQARRFVLYDKTSSVESLEEDLFFITSASKQTNHDWQTHHNDICIEWEGYFYNKFYMNNKLLNPVTPAPFNLIPIDSVYEQNKGLLPVSGTTNVDGIIQFNLNWLRFDRFGFKGSYEQAVQNFTRQRTCKSLNMSDGDTFVFHVDAIDIVNNSLVRNRTVFIDRTIPNVNNIYLVKNGEHMLFVHDSTELSTMLLYFEAFDIHSGVQNVLWKLETSDRSLTLGDGAIGAVTLDSDCGNESATCYCPSIGKCEHFNYTVSLNKLQALGTNNGNHNRNYVFTLYVTNHALLTSVEYLDILVDGSPPEKGVVFEGASGANEVDYTSDTEFLVNWHGFIDHESGIKKYIVAIGEMLEC
ncbi:hypothetical protein MAR_003968 [Mya arenaria]|uniref:Uncharacterized protein n=2 Tax=Mya arenaria TaxID=6604 RepID=A0ABY7EVA1_MYAAR|nr:hypothetical protein MAR_003968 [Mya arenaria]